RAGTGPAAGLERHPGGLPAGAPAAPAHRSPGAPHPGRRGRALRRAGAGLPPARPPRRALGPAAARAGGGAGPARRRLPRGGLRAGRGGVGGGRSCERVVAFWGALKAGGCYVPRAPGSRGERLASLPQAAAPPVLLTQARLAGRLPAGAAQVLYLDDGWGADADGQDGAPVDAGLAPEHLAYVIYTSGSTGRPKGAMNTHQGICNRLLWMQDAYRLTAADAVLQKTPVGFDVSVWELFWPLLAGARLALARPGGHQDPAYLAELIRAERVTVCHFVPSMLEAFLREPGLEQSCASLRDVVCSGEALGYELQERFLARLQARLHNLYGPTEAAVDVTSWACRRGDPRRLVPIGRPIANAQMHVLDKHLQEVPVGVPGELYIGGGGGGPRPRGPPGARPRPGAGPPRGGR